MNKKTLVNLLGGAVLGASLCGCGIDNISRDGIEIKKYSNGSAIEERTKGEGLVARWFKPYFKESKGYHQKLHIFSFFGKDGHFYDVDGDSVPDVCSYGEEIVCREERPHLFEHVDRVWNHYKKKFNINDGFQR